MRIAVVVLLLFFFIPPACFGQQPNFPGVRAAAEEQYGKWWDEHQRFESVFGAKLQAALTGNDGSRLAVWDRALRVFGGEAGARVWMNTPQAALDGRSPDQAVAAGDEPLQRRALAALLQQDFCGQNFKAKIEFLFSPEIGSDGQKLGLFNKQLEAQKLLYQLESKEAQKDTTDVGALLAGQDELEKHRQEELENARRERGFLLKQKAQLDAEVRKTNTSQGDGKSGALQQVPPSRGETAGERPETSSTEQRPVKTADGPGKVEQPAGGSASTAISANLAKALSELDAAVQLLDEKIRTLEDVGPVNSRTKESLASALRQSQARARQMREWDSLLDAQGEYWGAYYAMRSAQLREMCPSSPPPKPLIPPRPRIQQ